jgi:hypothetical protein
MNTRHDNVPADEAIVWTMLFSRMPESRNGRSTAIEMTAAGIDEENVSPDCRHR